MNDKGSGRTEQGPDGDEGHQAVAIDLSPAIGRPAPESVAPRDAADVGGVAPDEDEPGESTEPPLIPFVHPPIT